MTDFTKKEKLSKTRVCKASQRASSADGDCGALVEGGTRQHEGAEDGGPHGELPAVTVICSIVHLKIGVINFE